MIEMVLLLLEWEVEGVFDDPVVAYMPLHELQGWQEPGDGTATIQVA